MAEGLSAKHYAILVEMAKGTHLCSPKPKPGMIIKHSMPCPCGPIKCHLSVLVHLFDHGFVEMDGYDEDWHYYKITDKGLANATKP